MECSHLSEAAVCQNLQSGQVHEPDKQFEAYPPSSRGEREMGKVKACFAQGTHCISQWRLVEAECLPSIIHLCTEAL